MTMAYDSTIFRKVLKDALLPALYRLKQKSQPNDQNLFFPPFLTQQIGVVGFRHPEKLDNVAALHQRKYADDPIPFKNHRRTKREVATVGLPPGTGPGKSLEDLRPAVGLPQALPIRRNLLQIGEIPYHLAAERTSVVCVVHLNERIAPPGRRVGRSQAQMITLLHPFLRGEKRALDRGCAPEIRNSGKVRQRPSP